jgi:hypothetical protein
MPKTVKRFRFCEDCFECFTLTTPTDAICESCIERNIELFANDYCPYEYAIEGEVDPYNDSEVWTEFTRYERIVSTVTSRAGIAACRAALKEAANA